MAQAKDLNISPYYDDFDPSNNFYKVLFKPGFPVQARELTNLQSILQNQIESFGSHTFKEGVPVDGGEVTFDIEYYAVKVNSTQFGIDISLYTDQLIGKTVEGEVSGVTASVDKVVLPDGGDVENVTLYVKYAKSSPNDFSIMKFIDGEVLLVKENITYGNTTINADTGVATLISSDANATGSAAFVSKGIYFIRGTFVEVAEQSIILDHYTNKPSYEVGLKIDEQIISAKDDASLYDNAQGFTNYAAPGADRFKISLTLTKKLLDDQQGEDFFEILRIVDGKAKKINDTTIYSTIAKEFARRTYEESGNYSLDPFDISVSNSLNNGFGNGGLYFSNQKTEEGNTPSDDLMCLEVSEGEAYVKGYEVNKSGLSIIDVDKPRDVESVKNESVDFEMGQRFVVNNVYGQPKFREKINLYKEFNNGNSEQPSKLIGYARIYSLNSKNTSYEGATSEWNLYLWDVQIFTHLTLNVSVTSTEFPADAIVRGLNSGATGYIVTTSSRNLYQVTGSFIKNEEISVNGIPSGIMVEDVHSYNIRDVLSVWQNSSSSEFPGFIQDFSANIALNEFPFPNGINQVRIDGTTLTAGSNIITGIQTGNIIKYQTDANVPNYNRVTAVSAAGTSITVAPLDNPVTGVFNKTIGSNGTYNVKIVGANLWSPDNNGGLYEVLPKPNISSLDFSNSSMVVCGQITGQPISGAAATVSIDNVTDGSGVAISTAFFEPYGVSNYSIHYDADSAGVGTVTSDSFSFLGGGSQAQFTGLSDGDALVNITAKKLGIRSKTKNYEKSKILTIDLSRNSNSGTTEGNTLNDGLTYNGTAYGRRVQDEELSLNIPDVVKVLSVYESVNGAQPTFDTLTFNSTVDVLENAIIGENIVGDSTNAIARIVTNNSSTPSSGGANKLGIVYLTRQSFNLTETVRFEDSNITTTIDGINLSNTDGQYQDISKSYTLDKGQRDQFYDYSRLVRKNNTSIPSKQLLIVYDHYTVPSDDTGDVFTVLSYDKSRYTDDIPLIGNSKIRATDTLDFRPRVPTFSDPSLLKSPFTFDQRNNIANSEPQYLLKNDSTSILGYDYYLGRIDKLYLTELGTLSLIRGQSSNLPEPPVAINGSMELATIILPPYLYNPNDVSIRLTDNRRYTMRDIGLLEDRIENLEEITTLSLLEVSTESLTIEDANGNSRFKSGFFVDNFKTSDNINSNLSSLSLNSSDGEISPILSQQSLKLELLGSTPTTPETYDSSKNYELLDSNVQKTGNMVTLKYDEVSWIQQNLATDVCNVNPYHVVVYRGTVSLTPARDTGWTSIQYIDDSVDIYEDNVIVVENVVETTTSRRTRGSGSDVARRRTSIERDVLGSSTVRGNTTLNQVVSDELISTSEAEWMRSRNVKVDVKNLKPITKYYQFLDGISNVPFVPKLLEIANTENLSNSGSQGVFKIGETVKGYPVISNSQSTINRQQGVTDLPLISFRLCSPNHKKGSYNDPSLTYENSPYDESIVLSKDYTSSSTILNVDVTSLANEDQPEYNGFVWSPTHTSMYLIGSESGAKAWIKDIRLISDAFGDLQGSFYLQDPWSDPPAESRIPVGRKVYRLTSSPTNKKIVKGDSLNSFAQTRYESAGLVQNWSRKIENTWITDVTVTNNIRETAVTTTWLEEYDDPLAQSFSVGGNIEAPDPNVGLDDDQYGIFLTSVDLYFKSKDTKNNPLTVQVRTMRLGTPTREIVGTPVTLHPSEINVSDDAETATKVTWPNPIYLPPGEEYAIVLLSPESNEYQVYIARMNKDAINPSSIPNVTPQRYTAQWAIGSLFKSQNGSIWTASQMEDMKIKLYKAKFTSDSGTAFFVNPQLRVGNQSLNRMKDNPIVTLPKTGKIGITTILSSDSANLAIFSTGRKVVGSGNNNVTASIVSTGCSVTGSTVTAAGSNYKQGTTSSTVSTFNIIGKGSGLSFNNVDADANGIITDAEIVNPGTGYTTGDVVGLTTADLDGKIGSGALISITAIGGVDTLYVSNVHGTNGTNGFIEGQNIRYVNDSGSISGSSIPMLNGGLTEDGGINDGQHFQVNQINHGMHSSNNKLKLDNIESNLDITKLSVDLIDTSTQVSLASTIAPDLDNFEGILVDSNNPGYLKINNEIIKYESVGNNLVNTITRGIDSSQIMEHPAGSIVQKYELNGVSLRRINKEHDIVSTGIELDSYYVKIDAETGTDRSTDSGTGASGKPQLSFDNKGFYGGPNVLGTKNIQFESVIPNYDIIIPGGVTNFNASIRTVSGTSIDGTETSFIDQGYQPVQVNTLNEFTTPRLVASNVNETEYLDNISRNKSVTTAIELTTTDENVSPIILTDTSSIIFGTNRLNNPITDYTTSNLVNSSLPNVDPNSAIYVSNKITLNKPADSLKVLFSAYRHSSSDIRVLYSLIRPGDDANLNNQFELFPGYDNLRDTTGDGFGDQIIDSAKNDGKPDAFVPASVDNQFLEYQFSADNLGEFIGYSIKIIMTGTNQAYAPRIKELRTIALK